MRFLLSTDVLIEVLSGNNSAIALFPLGELAASAVSFEWFLSDIERDADLSAAERNMWRANIANFRKSLVQGGGQVPALSKEALERWGTAMVLDLRHDFGSHLEDMPSEERFVLATASELGLIYLTPQRDWNEVLRNQFGLALQVV